MDLRKTLAGSLLLLTAMGVALAGCSAEYYADRILLHDTSPGKLSEAAEGSGDDLIRRGEISACRRLSMADGTVIDTWIIRARPGEGSLARGTVVLLHGLLDSKARNLGLARRLAAAGFHAVLLDSRAHGRSTGQYVTWGALEKYDVKAVVDELMREGLIGGDLYVYGMSMGAATAVLYAAIDDRCRGVVAVAPYADARRITRRAMPLLPQGTFDRAWELAQRKARFSADQARVVEAARTLRCPLVVVHGQWDSIVPHEHGKEVYDACPTGKAFISLPATGHLSILLAREEWLAQQVIALADGKGR